MPVQRHQLSQQFFQSMAQLEALLRTPKHSLSMAETLIGMYTSCVEFYDSQSDPIKYYFVEKIQQIFVQDETLDHIKPTPYKDIPSKIEEFNPLCHQEKRINEHKVNLLNQDLRQTTTLVENYSQEVLQVDKLVRMDLNNQEENIQKRLERRRSTSQTRKEQKTPERRKLLAPITETEAKEKIQKS